MARPRCASRWPRELHHPDSRCPLFLEASHQRGGLGHAFISFNQVLTLAASLRLTLHARLETSAHGATAVSQLFGNHFYADVPSDAQRRPVRRADLATTVATLRRRCQSQGLAAQRAVILRLDKPPRCCETKGLNVCELRQAFATSRSHDRTAMHAPDREGDRLRIAVHIRRGDFVGSTAYGPIPRSAMVEVRKALPNRAYVRVVHEVLRILGDRRCEVVVQSDAGADVQRFPDANVTQLSNLTREFAPATVRLGPADTVAAFESLCTSDIVVTSRSGFSWMAAILCPKPVFLAAPFWHSLRAVPNVVPLKDRSFLLHGGGYSLRVATDVPNASWTQTVVLSDRFNFSESRFRLLLRSHRLLEDAGAWGVS